MTDEKELKRLAEMGGDDNGGIAPYSIGSAIAASLVYCSNVSAVTLATISITAAIIW